MQQNEHVQRLAERSPSISLTVKRTAPQWQAPLKSLTACIHDSHFRIPMRNYTLSAQRTASKASARSDPFKYTPSAMSAPEETGPDAMRIDRWLFAVRLFKTRSAAADAVGGGKVHLNGERVKPSHGVKPGDTVTFTRAAVLFECVVAAVPRRRGPASEAARSYDETLESKGRREEFAARMKVGAGLVPRPDDRPDKRDRRQMR